MPTDLFGLFVSFSIVSSLLYVNNDFKYVAHTRSMRVNRARARTHTNTRSQMPSKILNFVDLFLLHDTLGVRRVVYEHRAKI